MMKARMIMTESPETEKRICRYAGKCGACQTLNLSYDGELSLKMKKEITLLGRFGHVEEIIAMDDPLHYRNKVQYLLHYNGGRVNFGLYRASDGGIVHVDSCMMEDPEASSVCRTVRKLIDKYKLTVFDGRRGLVRHVMARRAFATGEIQCAIVTSDEDFPNAAVFASELCERHKAVKSVSRIINDTDTPLWMGGEEYVLAGGGTITDELCGCRFGISAKSFYQINPIQTEKLYETAAAYAEVGAGDRVLDAFCGIGTVGIVAAKNGCAGLCGFDVNADSIRLASANAQANGIGNAVFRVSDDAAFFAKGKEHYNVVFADPPRAGCSRRFLNFLLKQKPERIVYISCNPETLARDLAVLKAGYRVKKIQPVDMFPGTGHVETVVHMSKAL